MPLSGVDCYPRARITEIIGEEERERNKDIGMGISDASSMGIDIHASSWEAPWSGDLFSC
jgi:hypothetical protein